MRWSPVRARELDARLPLCSIASTRRSSRSAERNQTWMLLRDEIGCQTILADLGNVADARRAAHEAGDIDLLVNNAAIAILESFLETKVESWDTTMAINLRAVVVVSQIIANGMIERGVPGSIVNVSSMSSFQALPNHAAYAASKAGLDQLTKVMAVELGAHNIRVNSINPTVVMTDMGKRAWSDPSKGGPMLARIPLQRFAECEDIASVVCFVLSDAAGMVNGLALRVDGGFSVILKAVRVIQLPATKQS